MNRGQPCPDQQREEYQVYSRFNPEDMQNQDNTEAAVYADCLKSRPLLKQYETYVSFMHELKKQEALKFRLLV